MTTTDQGKGTAQCEARVRRELLLSALFEGLPQATVLADPERRIVTTNQALTRVFGYSREEIVGAKTTILYAHHEDFVQQSKLRLNSEVSDSPDPYRVDFRRKDGTTFPGEMIGTPIHADNGDMIGYIRIITDISERLAAEAEREQLLERVLQSQKMESLGVLAGGAAHDFNNLLVGVLANAALVGTALPPDSPIQEHVDDIISAGRKAADLAREMLAYAGKGRIVTKPVDLNDLVQDIAKLSRSTISKRTTIVSNYSDKPLVVNADATQLQQVVLNLLVNADEALKANGTVQITTGEDFASADDLKSAAGGDSITPGSYAWIDVADTGKGIAPEAQPRIFDPFFSTKLAGRGLGLASVLGIVRSHRGAIHVDSTPDQGTRFRIWLPLHPDPCSGLAAPDQPTSTNDQAKRGTILIIDDEGIVRKVGESVLQRRGYAVHTAVDGYDGIDVYERHGEQIDAVLLDLTMPGMDGQETLAELRKREPELPIVMVSGHDIADLPDLQSVLENSAQTSYLAKPYEADDLMDSIASVISGTATEPVRRPGRA